MSAASAKRWFVACVAALALVVAYPLTMAVPSTEAVRLRNAFLIEAGKPSDFAWTPAQPPADFRWERRPASVQFAQVARSVVGGEKRPFEASLKLAAHLLRNAQDRGPIQDSLEQTYRRITSDGYGYCADFTDVFLGLAHAAGIDARQWAFSFDGFGGDGHAFIEIYDTERGKWLMLDVYNNFYPVTRPGGEPLSALEFRQVLLDPAAPVYMQRISDGRLGYPIAQKAIDYYRRGAGEWYLWWGNDVFTYDAQPTLRRAALLGHSAEQLAAIATDSYPHFRVLDAAANAGKLQRMQHLRRNLLIALVLAVLLAFAAIMMALAWWRAARRTLR